MFNSYKNENNILYVLRKFDTAPIEENPSSKWMKFQYLATILSNTPNYKRYSEIIENSEASKKEYLKNIISTIDSTEIITSLKAVLNHIKNISKNEKVVMLNEMHWLPKHRIFAYELLETLYENGYRYLAIEAVDKEEDIKLNNRMFPIANTGYYSKEPFFGIFVRKAINLGFEIVAYDDFDTNNRERAQALNLKKVFEKDSEAKMFVYAGIDHILEENPSRKRMAEYFTELTAINPLTIDQVEIIGNSTEEISLVKAGLFEGNEWINTAVDFFVINNIEPSLGQVYNSEILVDFPLEIDELKKYKNQEVFLSAYFSNEYSKYKSSSVPLLNRIIEIAEPKINLVLPIGDFQLKIWDGDDNLIISKEITVIK